MESKRADEILHAVITELTLEEDAPLDAPIEVHARAVGKRAPTAGRQLVTLRCQLTNRFGTVAALSVEIEASDEAPADSTGTTDGMTDPDLECVDNIPV